MFIKFSNPISESTLSRETDKTKFHDFNNLVNLGDEFIHNLTELRSPIQIDAWKGNFCQTHWFKLAQIT